MSKPTILTVDDDAAGVRGHRPRPVPPLRGGYRVVRTTRGPQALSVLARLGAPGPPVALIAADQRMPQMTGYRADGAVADPCPRAPSSCCSPRTPTPTWPSPRSTSIGLDYYLLKPWDPPEDRLYPIVDDLLGDWRRGQSRADVGGPDRRPPVVGAQPRPQDLSWPATMCPTLWFDVERDDEGRAAAWTSSAAEPDELPLVLGARQWDPARAVHAPRRRRRARAARPGPSSRCTTCASSAPARPGLAAAVYAASEGLRTVLVEREAPGGQAGQCS